MLLTQHLTAVVVARMGSTRVKDKMHRPVGGIPLVLRKVMQLLQVARVDQIMVGTNDPNMDAQLKQLGAGSRDGCARVVHHLRPDNLCDEVSATPNDMVRNMAGICKEGMILWSHPTNPLCGALEYDEALNTLQNQPFHYDSLLSVTRIQSHFWYLRQPLNHDPKAAVHQPAARLEPLYFQNGAMFIRRQCDMEDDGRFVGDRPAMHMMDAVAGWDVDEEWQLRVAQMLAQGEEP